MADAPLTSFRLPADVLAALRQRGKETGESVSDMLRAGALMVLGICPTCGQKAPALEGQPAPEEPDTLIERAVTEAVDGDRHRIAAECERLAAFAPTKEQEAAYLAAAAMARGQYGSAPEEPS